MTVNLLFSALFFWLLPSSLSLLSASPISPSILKTNRPGCPDNAICTKKAGELRLRFTQTLAIKGKKGINLKKFRHNQGIPLEVWTQTRKNQSPKNKDDRIHYDSPCSSHNTDKKSYLHTEVFAPDFKSLLKKDSGVIVHQGYRLQGKKIVSYPIPRGDSPLYLKRNRIYFSRLFEGKYYAISINTKGGVKVESTLPSTSDLPTAIPCPRPLLDHFAKENTHTGLYTGSYCLKIPRIPKGHAIFLLGRSCF